MDKEDRKEAVVISLAAVIILVVDFFVVPYLIKKGDTVTSGWSPMSGQRTASLNALVFIILDLLLFIMLYYFFKYILNKFSK